MGVTGISRLTREPAAEIAQIAAAQSLRRKVGGEPVGFRNQGGQADSVYRDAGALPKAARYWTMHFQPRARFVPTESIERFPNLQLSP